MDALDTEVGVAVIVGVNDDEVGLGGGGGEGVGAEQGAEEAEEAKQGA